MKMKKQTAIKLALAKHWETEYQFQCIVAELLDNLGRCWTHVPNEGKRSPVTGARLKRAGLKKGFPDVIIIDGRIAIELKTKKGRMTPEQTDWQERLTAIGWTAVTCRDMQAVIDAIDEG